MLNKLLNGVYSGAALVTTVVTKLVLLVVGIEVEWADGTVCRLPNGCFAEAGRCDLIPDFPETIFGPATRAGCC